MGVYGESLLCFAEQFRSVSYFNQTPTEAGGWEGKTTPVVIRGVLHSTGPRAVKDSNGNLVKIDKKEFWTSTELTPGYFLSYGSEVYRLLGENNWSFEDGFYKYGIEKVVGDDGTLTYDPGFETGAGKLE